MAELTLKIRYSVPDLFGRTLCCAGIVLVSAMFVHQMASKNSWIAFCYFVGAISAAVGLMSLYRLLTAKDDVVVSIDATGFKDTRLTPTVIPWSAIQSVGRSYSKARTSNVVIVSIDPAFKRGIPIRLGAELLRWANFSFGSMFYLDVGTLDTNADEIIRATQQYLPKQG